MSRVRVRDVELEVLDEGNGLPVVWGHGLFASMASDDEAGGAIAPVPRGERFRVIRYDARGHGASQGTTRDRDYRWSSLALDMLGVLDASGVDGAVVGGASMGCATALHVAVTAPSRVRGLVLVIPPTAWGGRRAQAVLYRAGAALVAAAGIGPFARAGRAAPVPRILTGELSLVHEASLRSMAAMPRDLVPHILRGAASSDLPRKDLLARIHAPALVLAWKGDPTHPTATAEELDRLLPHSQLHVATSASDVLAWPSLVAVFLASI